MPDPISLNTFIEGSTGAMLVETAQTWVRVFKQDFIRYLAGAGGVFLVINLMLAAKLRGRKIRPNTHPSRAQMRREFLYSTRTVAVFSTVALFTIAAKENGLTQLYLDSAERGWWYFGFSIAALIVLHDAWFYWTHRLIHDLRLFRSFHKTHHKSFAPTPWTAYSFDIGEAALNAIFVTIALIIIPVSPIALAIFLAHMMLRNAIGHCGYEIFPSRRDGRPLFDWMTSVTHHDLHHSQAGWNYGLYFTWWDRLMETEHPLYHEKFAQAVGKPLDGSAVRARKSSAAL
ncbi:sterol desaturase family protein [Hyphococcus flavus]|uniref:Sterol desaturase family protein n=1 Tax=Hyphococcus flavus TaxID=1866326 RepID=A0AAE9ZAT1_9PROT|nr:sterol desaturase family protein [Hyphococcus flavus]WDI30421.1 sterol desaturase family protein [Hyphococcus flavus]